MKSQKNEWKQNNISVTSSQELLTTRSYFSQIVYNQLKLSISSSVISQIYSQLCISTSDFYGLLLGEHKIINTTESKDIDSNFQQNTLHLITNNIIFIFDKHYLREKLEKLLDKINQKYTIIGLFSARSYSYTSISLKEQEFYINAWNYLKNKSSKKSNQQPNTQNFQNIPLLYGVFSHNVTEEEFDNKLRTQNFYSKIFKFEEKNNSFESLPYDILNIKDTNYTSPINHLSSKTVIDSGTAEFEKPICKLKNIVLDQMSHLEFNQQRELKELKMELKKELNINKKLYDMLKMYET